MASIIYAGDGGAFKICRKCGQPKHISDFSGSLSRPGWLQSRCKPCVAAYSRAYYQENRLTLRTAQRAAQQTSETREKGRERMARWRQANRERSREQGRGDAAKVRSTPAGRLDNAICSAMWKTLRDKKAGRSWESLVGYTVQELMEHLEKQFLPGMEWSNHGSVWHVDHVVPKSLFNYSEPEHIDFQRCWALTNLQPMWAKDNLSKGAKLKAPFQPSLAI